MKKNIILLLFLVFSGFNFAQANEAGVILGSVSGLSAKFDLARSERAVDLALAYKFDSNSSISFHADYLIENARHFDLHGAKPLALYYGLGVRLVNINSNGANKGKTSFGPRAPIGVEYVATNPDISVFGELALNVDLAPESLIEITGGVGVRIRF